jgi:hypothetical protein
MTDEERIAVLRYWEATCCMMIARLQGDEEGEKWVMGMMDDLWWAMGEEGMEFTNTYSPLVIHKLMGYDTKWGKYEVSI